MALAPVRVSFPAQAKQGDIIEIKALIRHVMETGYRSDASSQPIPRDIITSFGVTYSGEDVFRMELNPGVSANPYVTFSTVATQTGELVFTLDGSERRGNGGTQATHGYRMTRAAALFGALLILVLGCRLSPPALAGEQYPAPVSGSSFLSAELKQMQEDEFANPGMLWVEEGKRLWQTKNASGAFCGSCHGDAVRSMKGVAARLPAIDPVSGKPVNLEQRINLCRTGLMKDAAFPYESNELLALTAYIAYQSRGLPMDVEADGAAAPYYERGKALFTTRQGQFNLACSQCHAERAGRRLRGDVISYGVGVGYPVYRLEWQGLGSLHRRMRACSFGVRARQFDAGSDEYVSLELYLAKRAQGVTVDAPAIRK
jgi:L-cysteine S-thiosulfotransferase